MDEIEERLKKTADTCIKTYEAWVSKKEDISLRETLQDAVHELRKVAARVEIEVAVSERKETTQKPLPIPSHRSSQKRPQKRGGKPQEKSGNSSNGHDDGNELPSFISGGDGQKGSGKPKPKLRAPKKPDDKGSDSKED